VFSSILAACAEGAPASSPDVEQANSMLGQPVDMCGDGIRGKTEPCECPKTATMMCAPPEGVDCASLNMGTGNVYCAAGACTLITSMCSASTGPVGGMGGAGRGM
jgi:hypothetical protein